MRTHSNVRPYTCPECGAAFKFKAALNRHATTQHTEHRGKKHKCEQCDKRFHELGHLKEHLLTHTEERPFWCDTCRVGFRHRYKYNVHMLAHRLKEGHLLDTDQSLILRCDICEKDFTRKDHYKNHIRIHSVADDIPFRCNICSKGFRWQTSLNAHRKRHKRDDACDKWQTHCDKCQRGFASKYQMKLHQREHLPPKEYTCLTCDQSFGQRCALAQHERSEHPDKRPHLCEVCGLTFKSSQYLAGHRRRCHADYNRHTCFECGVNCWTLKASLAHRKTHLDSAPQKEHLSEAGNLVLATGSSQEGRTRPKRRTKKQQEKLLKK